MKVAVDSTLLSRHRESPDPSSQAQHEVGHKHAVSPINNGHHHTSVSRSPSPTALSSPATGSEPESEKQRKYKRGRQDTHTETSSRTDHSVDIDNTCDAGDESPRPAKQRRPCLAPLDVCQSCSLTLPSTADLEVKDARPQAKDECPQTSIHDKHHHTSRISRNPSAATDSIPVTEYREWPFQGFLKRTKIRDNVAYKLEFELPLTSEHLYLPIDPEILDISSRREIAARSLISHDIVAYSKTYQTSLRPRRNRIRWTAEEDATLLRMWKDGCLWEDIAAALPGRSIGAIRVRCSTKFKK